MMLVTGMYIDHGEALLDLAADQAKWSQETFGSDRDRGPLGALRHLEKEAKEAQEDETNINEYADCLLLLLDATRRGGFTLMHLLRAAQAKMEVNKKRSWPKPVSDTPVEHVRDHG
jgi:hypothetical protein